MLKIKSKHSTVISIVLAVLFFIGCAVGAFFIPQLTDTLINIAVNSGSRPAVSQNSRTVILICAYAVLADLILADIFLFALLMRVRRYLVFSAKSVTLIRCVAWCCLALGGFFGLLGIYFRLSLLPAFAAIFLGLCLRVVKNVIEEATEIKSENDLTI